MPRGGIEVWLSSVIYLGARWGEWLKPRPGHFIPEKKNRYPFYKRLGGQKAGLDGLPPGFDPWTVQLLASRYTD
jgi:hypothetical protein